MTQLLGYLLHRVNYNSDRKLAVLGIMIMKGEDITLNRSFNNIDAVTLMHDLTLTKEQMRVLRQYMLAKGVFFPNTTDLLHERKTLKPTITRMTELLDKGVEVDYVDLVRMTTASVIDAINYRRETPLNPISNYRMYYKDGGDGAGGQMIWNSKSMIGAASHIFQYSIVPLRLECVSK